MKLYYSRGACSLAPHIVLREAGYDFDLEKVDIPKKQTASGEDFWKINPKGYVPALEMDDGEILTEVGVICQYLADQKPGARLAPDEGTMERYRLMEWLSFVATEVHKQIGALFNPNLTAEMKSVQKSVIERRLKTLDGMLQDRDYLMGDAFSVADAYAYTVLNWTRLHKIDMTRFPNVTQYMARCAGRPKVQDALKAEGLIK